MPQYFSPLPAYDFRNQLDMSPLSDALTNWQNVQFKSSQLGMEQDKLDMEKALQPLKRQALQQNVDAGQLEYEQNLFKRFGGVAQAMKREAGDTSIPEDQRKARADEHMRMITSHPGMKRMLDSVLPPGWESNHGLVSGYIDQVARGYVDQTKEALQNEELKSRKAANEQNVLTNPIEVDTKKADLAIKLRKDALQEWIGSLIPKVQGGSAAPAQQPKPQSFDGQPTGVPGTLLQKVADGASPQQPQAANISPRDFDIMVRTVAGEAGAEPPEGQQAVAAVILNRARAQGKTPSEIALAPGQFEAWQRRKAELERMDPNSPEYQRIAQTLAPLLSGQASDPTGGATHFYAPDLQAKLGRQPPSWANGPGLPIGNHRFYTVPTQGGSPQVAQAQAAPAQQPAPPPPAAGAATPSTNPADIISSRSPTEQLAFALTLQKDPAKAAALLQEWANPQALAKPTHHDLDKAQIGHVNLLGSLKEISKQLDPKFLRGYDKLGYEVDDFRSKWLPPKYQPSPEATADLQKYQAFRATAMNNVNTRLKELSGTAVTESEMNRIMRELPDPGTGPFSGDSPPTFKAKMDNGIRLSSLAVARFNYLRANGFAVPTPAQLKDPNFVFPIGVDDMPGIIQKRGDQLQQEILKANPKSEKAVIEQAVGERLKQEFGI